MADPRANLGHAAIDHEVDDGGVAAVIGSLEQVRVFVELLAERLKGWSA